MFACADKREVSWIPFLLRSNVRDDDRPVHSIFLFKFDDDEDDGDDDLMTR